MKKIAILITCGVIFCGNTWSAEAIRQVQLELARGAPLKKLSGKIKGDESVTYSVTVPAGGGLELQLKSKSPSIFFNVTAEGAEEALFVGSRDGDRFAGVIPAPGVYRITVYLMRNAARRNQTASYVLEVGAR